MTRKNDDYELTRTGNFGSTQGMSDFEALMPWMICVFIIAPLLIVVGGLPWFPVFMVMPWIGLLFSIIFIDSQY